MANILTASAAQIAQPITQGNVVSESAFPTVAGGSTRFTTGAPSIADGRVFRLRCAARVTGGTTTNYTLKLYWSNSVNTDLTTFTGDINIVSSAAIPVNSATGIILLQSDLVWDSTSQKLDGGFMIFTNNTTRAWTNWVINTAAATGVAAASNLKFFATGLFSATNANNAATIFDFSLDQL